MSRTAFANVALVMVSLGLSFAGGEYILRHSSLSDRLGWTRIPPIEERLADMAPSRPDQVRLLGLGDSFTEYRDTDGLNYLRFAEQAAGGRLSVVNLAQAGSGPDSYRANFRAHGRAVRPDVVTVGLYLGNDISATACMPNHRPEEALPTWKDALKRQSVLLNYLYRMAKTYIPALHSGHFDRLLDYGQSQSGLSDQDLARRLAAIDPKLVDLARADAINPWDLAWGLTNPTIYSDMVGLTKNTPWPTLVEAWLSCMGRFAEEIKARGALPVFVLIPVRLQVSETHHDAFRRLGYQTSPDLVGDSPLMKQLVGFLEDKGVPYLNLLPVLQRSGGDLFIPMDVHFNTEGQRVAGEALHDYLLELGVL